MKRVLFRSRDGRELHSRFSSYTAPFLLNGNGSCCFFDTTGSPSLAAGTVFVLVRTIFRPGFPVCCLLNQQSRRRPSPFRHRLITVLAPPCTGLAPAEPLPGDAANIAEATVPAQAARPPGEGEPKLADAAGDLRFLAGGGHRRRCAGAGNFEEAGTAQKP